MVKCSLALGQRRVFEKASEGAAHDGEFFENREDWRKGKTLWRSLCGPEETIEEQRQRISWYTNKKRRKLHRTKKVAEISVDLELQAKAFLSDKKVSGLEDSVVSEMIKQLPLEKFT